MATQHDGINPHTAADLLRKAMLQKLVVASPLPLVFVLLLLLLPTPLWFSTSPALSCFSQGGAFSIGPFAKLSSFPLGFSIEQQARAYLLRHVSDPGRWCCVERASCFGHRIIIVVSCSFHFHMEFRMSSSVKKPIRLADLFPILFRELYHQILYEDCTLNFLSLNFLTLPDIGRCIFTLTSTNYFLFKSVQGLFS